MNEQLGNQLAKLRKPIPIASADSLHCTGYNPGFDEPASFNYPMEIHKVVQSTRDAFYFDAETGTVRSSDCARYASRPLISSAGKDRQWDQYQCERCALLRKNEQLANVLLRSRDVTYHERSAQPLAYFTTKQLHLKLSHRSEEVQEYRLSLLNQHRKTSRVMGHRDASKAVIVSIASENVARVKQLLALMLRQKRSTKAIICTLKKAAEGLYSPKQFDNYDLDTAILALRFGGQRLLYSQNKSMGSHSDRTFKRIGMVPRYITMASEILMRVVVENYNRFVFGEDAKKDEDGTKCLYVMMMDDIKGEKRCRVDEYDGHVRGLCYHAHQNKISLELKSEEDCQTIKQGLKDNRLHYATEITNIALAPIREKSYSPMLVATSAGCQQQDPQERTETLVRMAITVWVKDHRGQRSRGVLSTIQPDGASTFVTIGHKLFFSEEMTDSHALYKHLVKLPLMCLYTGKDVFTRITMGCEMKHAFKRARERLKSETPTTLFKWPFTGSHLRDLLVGNGVDESVLNPLFATGFADAMEVPSMVKFFELLGNLHGARPEAFGARNVFARNIYKELQLLCRYCKLIFTVVADKRPSLGNQLENISELMHIMFVCHRRNGTSFMANQTYANHQRLYRSIYWSIANALEEGVDYYFMFQDSGDALEMFYCLLRTLVGGASGSGSGMDVLQAGERISGCMQVNNVYARHPELRKASRHLATTSSTGTDDHQNPRSFLSTDEKGTQDRRRVAVDSINLLNRFMEGRQKAKAALQACGFSNQEVDWDEIAKTKVDFLRPKGVFVGTSRAGKDAENVLPQETSIDDGVFVEEELGPAPEDDATLAPKMRRFGTMSAAACLRMTLASDRQHQTETSRVARQRGTVKSGTALKSEQSSAQQDEDEYVVRAGEDMLVTLVHTDEGISVAIVMPQSFTMPDGKTKAQNKIQLSSLEATVTIKSKIIHPTFDNDCVQWEVGLKGNEDLEIQWKHTSLFNPDLIRKKDQEAIERDDKWYYSVSCGSLDFCLQTLYLKFRKMYDRGVLPHPLTNSILPYRRNNDTVFIAEDSSKLATSHSTAASVSAREGKREVECAIQGCSVRIELKHAGHHAAYHLLHDETLETKVGCVSTSLCGMCAAYPAEQYRASDCSSGGCPVWMEEAKTRTKGWKVHTRCKLFGLMDFNLKIASKSNKSSPSSNVPIACPQCPREPMQSFYWKYNFQKHWDACHTDDKEMPADLKTQLKITETEKEWLKTFKNQKKIRVTKKRKTPSTSEELAGHENVPPIVAAAANVRVATPDVYPGTPDTPGASTEIRSLKRPVEDEDSNH